MSNLDRRDFVKLGAGGLAGVALGGEVFGSPGRQMRLGGNAVDLSASFFMQPGLIAQIDPKTKRLLNYNLWAVNSTDKGLVQGLLSPVEVDLRTLEEWGKGEEGFMRFRNEVPFLHEILQLSPAVDVAEVVGRAALALHEGNSISLSVDFLHPQESLTFGYDISSESGFPVVDRVGNFEKDTKLFRIVDLYGWRFIFRGPDYHNLGDCVRTSVWHYNLEIQRSLGGGRYTTVSNFHLGKYGNGSSKCFVLWNNLTPRICWKVCTPNYDNLKQMLAWSLSASAAAAGVYLAGWMVSAIAAAGASVIYVPLLLL